MCHTTLTISAYFYYEQPSFYPRVLKRFLPHQRVRVVVAYFDTHYASESRACMSMHG
jgi:hypothetical protein